MTVEKRRVVGSWIGSECDDERLLGEELEMLYTALLVLYRAYVGVCLLARYLIVAPR